MDPWNAQGYPPPMVGTAPPVVEPPPLRELHFRFTGTPSEYFRIWIVNIALTVLTLGVYSAWAKVRTKQYFYRHTWVDDSSFEYLASPIPILKGRIIVGLALGFLLWSQTYNLHLYFGLLFVMVLLTPLVLTRSLAFNARNSAYRNIRFGFVGSAGEAFGVYLLMLLVYVVTCGIGYPYAQWRLTSFVVQRHLYGDQRFEWYSLASQYFRVFLISLLMTLPGVLVLIAIFSIGMSGGQPSQTVLYAGTLVFYAFLLIPFAYTRANIANLLYGGMTIGLHRLRSGQRAKELIWLYVSNAVAILFSLGLLAPWARIRLARYRAERLSILASGPLTADRYDLVQDPNALGDAATDLGDFDFDIGL